MYEPFEKLTKQRLNNLASPYIAFFIFDPKNNTHVKMGEKVRKFVAEQIQKQSKIGTQIQFTYTSYQKGLIRDALIRTGVDPDDSAQARLLLFSMRKGNLTNTVITEFDNLET